MSSELQRAYLDAMGIGVWCLRESPSTSSPEANKTPGLKLGPGNGGILLICAVDSDSDSRLASDISRSLGSVPVWAWPHADDAAVKLNHAIETHLFTTVAIFGRELATRFFDGELPASLNSAKLVLLPSIQDLHNRADSRQVLWASFCRSGMINPAI